MAKKKQPDASRLTPRHCYWLDLASSGYRIRIRQGVHTAVAWATLLDLVEAGWLENRHNMFELPVGVQWPLKPTRHPASTMPMPRPASESWTASEPSKSQTSAMPVNRCPACGQQGLKVLGGRRCDTFECRVILYCPE